MAEKQVYAVTVKAEAEMIVWVEAESPRKAKAAARAGDYEVMTHWEPVRYSDVRAVSAKPSEWPPDRRSDD